MDLGVAVVGGGIVGCAIGRALAPDHEVCVLDKAEIAAGATGRAAGLVTPAAAYADLPAVARHADDFVRAYAGRRGVRFTSRASIEPVPSDDADLARRRVNRLAREGAPVSFLNADTAVVDHPQLDLSGYAGFVRFNRAGFLDPVAYARALLEDARNHGATVRTGVKVTGIRTDGGAIVGVDTSDGIIHADAVVLAAGPSTTTLVGNLPLQPYRSQCAIVDVAGQARDAPMGVAPDGRYFRPTADGDLLVGGRAEVIDDPDMASTTVDDDFLADAADLAADLLHDAGPARPLQGWAGVDVATPDARPIIDAPARSATHTDNISTDDRNLIGDFPDGLVLATGFTGLGVSVVPAAAALVRSILLDRNGLPRDPFALDRFAGRPRDFSYLGGSTGEPSEN